MLEVADKVQIGNVVKPRLVQCKTQVSQRNGRSSPPANAGRRSISLEGRGDRGAICSLVTADACLGPLGGVSQRAKLLVNHAGAMCQAQSGN
jgi:hypothetical protein